MRIGSFRHTNRLLDDVETAVVARDKPDTAVTNPKAQTSSLLMLAPWIHCLAQVVMAATVVFYFEHLQGYFHHEHRAVRLPVFTQQAIHLRHWLWLIPLAFVVGALWMSARKRSEVALTSIFSACSVLVLVCMISLAVLVTRAPFSYCILLEAP